MLAVRYNKGFTLIELMITLVIAGILLAVGVPSFQTVLQNSRSAALATDISSAINLARAEAIRRGEPVQVCAGTEAAGCSGAWTSGWIVRVPRTLEILRVWPASPSGSVIDASTSVGTLIEFGALGDLPGFLGVLTAPELTVSVTGCSGDRARELTFAATGRVSISRAACPL